MNVGLVAVDSLIPNLALMKLSAWHKAQGDHVEVAFPLAADTYDRVYRSKQFVEKGDDYPDDRTPWPCEVVSGGTGYDLTARLPEWGDTTYPDYGLYGCTEAMGRFTRGCPRACPFCVVGKMDGTRVHQVAELDDFWHGQEVVRLLDDNLTAMPDLFVSACDRLAAERVRVKFEAIDARLMTADMARSLAKVRREGRAHFAFDHVRDEDGVRRGITALKAGGFPLYAATFYVLVGYDSTPEEDTYRIDLLDALGVESFVMPYKKDDPYQRRLARDTNRKAIFRTTHPRRGDAAPAA
jgi:hypothetical protein